MLANNALDSGQTYTGAFEVFLPMEALEHAKELVGIFHVETHAVITNKDCRPAVLNRQADFDSCPLLGLCELDGVGQKIEKDLLDQAGIAFDRGQHGDVPIHLPVRKFRTEIRLDVRHQGVEVGSLESERLAANARQVQ